MPSPATVYISERVVPYEQGWTLGVADNLKAAKRLAQDESDRESVRCNEPKRKIKWTRRNVGAFVNGEWVAGALVGYEGDDHGRYDSFFIDVRKVLSE